MASTQPPWTPDMDPLAAAFYDRLNAEKYGGHIDDEGVVRWCSEWRMHVANGLSTGAAYDLIAQAIDTIRAGGQPAATPAGAYDVPWDPSMQQWCEPFLRDLRALYANEHPFKPQPVDSLGYVRWSSDFRLYMANGYGFGRACVKVANTIRGIWGVPVPAPPAGAETRRPLVGLLRVVNKLFADDTGYRRVFFDSWFNALRVLRDEPDKFYRWLDDTVRAGYQGSRIFLSVGGWTPYWSGYGVHPVGFREWQYSAASGILRPAGYGAQVEAWPEYDDLLRTLLREYRKRKLRLHVTTGDCQIITPDAQQELDLQRRLARICREEGGTDVIAAWEVTNEYPMNRFGSDSPESIAQMGRVIAAVRESLPDVLCCQGAGLSEEPEVLTASSTHGQLCAVHTIREPFGMCMKRTFGLVWWEGNYRGFPKPFLQGEPKGTNVPPFDDGKGDDMYLPMTRPCDAVALYAMHALTGQWSNFFDGGSVRSTADAQADAWGYDELPELFEQHLPEDVALWPHSTNGRGGIAYWSKGDEFATATFEEWDTAPPRPVAKWTLYTGDSVRTGTGTPPRGTGLLTGRFA